MKPAIHSRIKGRQFLVQTIRMENSKEPKKKQKTQTTQLKRPYVLKDFLKTESIAIKC
jgi:hypothetical protein